ncbi:MAG: hypothetical protein JW959_03665 [Pirellulales bacterium]|nr:hypothetical protein [Pirellulales bacterium]
MLFAAKEQSLNLSEAAVEYLQAIGATRPAPDMARALFFHLVSVMYSPTYRTENAAPLRQDWPRIPLPDSRAALEASATLGERIAALLDTEAEVNGVTCGKIDPALKTIALTTKIGGGAIDPSGDDLAVAAGWGHFGKAGAVMPGKGKIEERNYSDKEAEALAPDARRLLGEKTVDVFLNREVYWRNVPMNVWKYHIGGYQVLKKWLSYRELEILGRPLKPDEAREVMNTARRIAAIILMQPRLDENYRAVKSAAFDWNGGK